MKRVNSRRGLRILMPTSAIVLFSFLLVLLAACGDSSITPVPASATTVASTTAAATTAASSTTAAATTSAADTTAAATTPAATTAPSTTSGATTPSTTPGANAGTTAKGKSLDTAKGTVDSFDSSTGTLAVKETSGQTTDFNASKATITGVSKISLADFSKISLTGKTVEFSATPGSDGSFTPTALTVLDQPAMSSNANAKGKGTATDAKGKGKKAGGSASTTASATDTPSDSTPSSTAGTTDSNHMVLHNVSLSGNTLTGTSASGTSITVNLSDTTTLNQRISEKMSDLAAGDKLTVDYKPLGKKATGPADAIAIVIEK